MLIAVDALPWSALQLRETEIPWTDLRQLAGAAEQSGDVRNRLKHEMNQLLEKRYAEEEESFSDFTDLAVPAVFALAAERLDEEGRQDAASYLINLLYRAGEADDDFLLEIVQSTAGLLGTPLIEPAICLIEAEGHKLECWFFLWTLLNVAKDAIPPTKEQVIDLCKQMLRNLPDRFSPYSYADGPARLLANLAPAEALPLIEEIAEKSKCPEMREIVEELRGKEPPLPPIAMQPWLEPVEEWLPRRVGALREWLRNRDSDEESEFDDDATQLFDSHESSIGVFVDGSASDPSQLLRRTGTHHGGNGFKSTPILGKPRGPGRNAPCPCGSGKKFKKCCGR